LEAGSVLPSLNFPQLDFVRPSSGFHPVTWERVTHTVNKQKHQEFFVFRTLHPKTQKQKKAKEEEETHFIHSLTLKNVAWGRARPPICLTKASTNFK
jgi:hypothetical protein